MGREVANLCGLTQINPARRADEGITIGGETG